MLEPTSEQWLELHQAFKDYCQAAPWEQMDDTDLVAIEHPSAEYNGYCVVLGMGGIEFGLAVYIDDEGLAGYLEAVSGDLDSETPEILETMNAISAQLGDREHLTQADRDIIRSLGLRYRGRGRWPVFRRAKPGFAPWRLSGDEAVFLTAALQNITDAAARIESGGLDLYGDEDYSRILTRTLNNGAWQDRWDVFVMPSPRPVPDFPDPERLQRLADSKPQSGNTWEFGYLYIYAPVQEEKGERPFFPLAAFICDQVSKFSLPDQFVGPDPTPTDRQEMLVKLLERLPVVPSEIVVNKARTAQIIEPVTAPLGIQISVGDTFNIYEIRAMMNELF